MTSNKLSGSGKRLAKKLIWTRDMRLTLDLLKENDDLTWAIRAALFNRIYDDYIKSCGYTEAVSWTTLRCQCSDAEKRKNKDWIEIATLPKTPEYVVKLRSLSATIEATLALLPVSNDDGDSTAVSTGHNSRSRHITTPPPRRQVPLSEQTPIAYWSPPSTPQRGNERTAQPKRSLAALAANGNEVSEDDADAHVARSHRPKRSWTGRATRTIQVPEDEADDHVPRPKRQRVVVSQPRRLRESELDSELAYTPVASSSRKSQALIIPGTPCRSPRKVLPKTPFPRPDDDIRGHSALLLTAEEHELLRQPLASVPEELAHPPMPGLCFRYWRAEPDQLRDSETGFKARTFELAVPVDDDRAPPTARQVFWTDIINHVNKNKIATPYISVTVAFWWALRLALKDVKEGVNNGRLTVIDTSRLDKAAVFHVLPYHRALKTKKAWVNGAWNYPGTYEYLVWKEIPGDAIIKTVKIADLINFAEADAMIGQALAFELLQQRGSYDKVILPTLRERSIHLSPDIIACMARLAAYLGLDPTDMAQISHLVTDIIQYWAINLRPSEWATFATVFENSLCQSTGGQLNLQSQEARVGFLDGVRWATAKGAKRWHATTRRYPDLIATMMKQATMIGVDDPIKILTDELDAAKVRVRMLGAGQNRLLRSSLGQGGGAINDDGEDAGSDEETTFDA